MGNKTKVGLLLVAALIFVIAAPAFAASPQADQLTATDAAGNPVATTVSTDVSPAIVASAEAAIGITANEKIDVWDITISGGTPPYRITIPFAGSSAKVYHYENGEWVLLDSSVENGEIVAYTNSASPFAIVSSIDVSNVAAGTIITLPAGATYYTMVEGAPGAAHTLKKATQVQIVERLGNGYTKILMNNMTYLIKTSGAVSTGSRSPKTGAESDMGIMLLIAGAALASAAVFAGRKALKAKD